MAARSRPGKRERTSKTRDGALPSSKSSSVVRSIGGRLRCPPPAIREADTVDMNESRWVSAEEFQIYSGEKNEKPKLVCPPGLGLGPRNYVATFNIARGTLERRNRWDESPTLLRSGDVPFEGEGIRAISVCYYKHGISWTPRNLGGGALRNNPE